MQGTFVFCSQVSNRKFKICSPSADRRVYMYFRRIVSPVY